MKNRSQCLNLLDDLEYFARINFRHPGKSHFSMTRNIEQDLIIHISLNPNIYNVGVAGLHFETNVEEVFDRSVRVEHVDKI